MARHSLGAVPTDGGVSFTVWAPRPSEVRLLLVDAAGERVVEPSRTHDGYWHHEEPGAAPGLRYGYLLDGDGPFPDPCSRRQPEGPHELSAVVESSRQQDAGWNPPPFEDLVIYELHIGTFTSEGTFAAAAEELPRLAAIGINAIEIMPVASFPGRWNWGYDGVSLWAPFEGYGGPDGLRELVRAAHRNGIAVILDVVYNHFGPDGNYAALYAREYYRPDRHTPWGDAINFDGEGASHVREFFLQNARHWIEEYGIDGLRLDATHTIFDESERHILAELSQSLRETTPRPVYLIAETHENDARYVQSIDAGGFGFDAIWADDFHHAARTAVAGDHEAYFAGFQGLESLERIVERGWLYDGGFDPSYGEPRGGPPEFEHWRNLLYCIQNHDQVGNRAFGDRLAASAGEPAVRALTTLLLLLPATPMLFQGQEFGATTPFLYFTDHAGDLGEAIRQGRRAEFARFSAYSDAGLRDQIPDPQAEATFKLSKLPAANQRGPRAPLFEAFHRALIDLRRTDPVLRGYRQARLPLGVERAGDLLVVRFSSQEGERLLAVNLGGAPAGMELPGGSWRCLLNSDEAAYGGLGAEVLLSPPGATVPRRSAAFFGPE